MKTKVTIHDIKGALLDERFRVSLPEVLSEDVQKFLSNPGCGCNHPIYINVMKHASKQITEYFPNKQAEDPKVLKERISRLARNDWVVINCGIHELSDKLKELGAGRLQLDIARYQDQVTVVANRLEVIF